MSFRATVFRRSCSLVLLLAWIGAPAAHGQLKTSPIAFANEDAITTTLVTAPNLAVGSGSGSGAPVQWLKVEFHYGTTALVTKDYPYVDSIEFKVWVEGVDPFAPNTTQPSGKGVAVALTGSVTYINVPMARDLYGVFYVSSAVLARYSDRVEDFDRKFDVHVEAYVGGVLVDEVNKNKEADPLKWFVPLKVVPDLVYRQDQCPFIVSDPDRYPMIKPTPAP